MLALVGGKGAGYKRKYDYVALLEFSLVKVLGDLGWSIDPIREFMADLRADNIIRSWGQNFSDHKQYLGSLIAWWRDRLVQTEKWFEGRADQEPTDLMIVDFALEFLKKYPPDKDPEVTLLCVRTSPVRPHDTRWNFEIVPQGAEIAAIKYLECLGRKGIGHLAIDLTRIKKSLDQKILQLEEKEEA